MSQFQKGRNNEETRDFNSFIESQSESGCIGPFKLLQQIGEGGMGSVWMAQQEKPVKRRVALKVIKAGMDSKQVIARFEAERQALAMMDHPNIAHVLDIGTTEQDRPYFVMELVKGLPLTKYCDDNRVTLENRLRLFTDVCRAVQHAHQKGIIHRDLKPSNILVADYDNQPVAKIIDFGLAKALNQQLTDKTMFTQLGQVVGTFEYMSPEQSKMNQLDVDTRTDIYSLGVILYELLTGTKPFEPGRLRSAALDEVMKIIREEDPPKPSTRLSQNEALPSVAVSRRTEPRKLSTFVKGDLDWIVMKALDKERGRRYETANGLAMDIQRFLNDEQVLACPPSTGYRFRKFVRRNKVAMVAGALLLATLLIGILGTTWQAFEATKQRDRALKAEENAKIEASISQAVNAFLNEDLLSQASPANQPDRDITLRSVLDVASRKIENRFEDQPMIEAAIRETIAQAYYGLGVYEQAEHHFRMRHTLLKKELGSEDERTLANLYELAKTLDRQDKFAEAENLHRECLKIYNKSYDLEHMGRLNNMNGLANALWNRGSVVEASRIYQEIAEIAEVKYPDSGRTLIFRLNSAWGIEYLGRYEEAERQYKDALSTAEELPDIGDHVVFSLRQGIARAQWRQGKLDEAEQGFRDILRKQASILGKDHPETLQTMTGLANVLNDTGDFENALQLCSKVIELQPQAIGADNFFTLQSYMSFGTALLGKGQFVDAEAEFRKVYRILQKRHFSLEYLDLQQAANGIAATLVAQEKFAEAEDVYRDLLKAQTGLFGPNHPDTRKTQENLEKITERQSK